MSPSNLLIRKMTESALLKPALSFGSKPDSHCLVYVLANPCYHLASTACFLAQRICVIITSRHLPGVRVKFFTFQISVLYSPHSTFLVTHTSLWYSLYFNNSWDFLYLSYNKYQSFYHRIHSFEIWAYQRIFQSLSVVAFPIFVLFFLFFIDWIYFFS